MSKTTSKKLFVSYYRVSTDRQGKSGLGLEAQKETVRKHIKDSGELVAEYTEIESGRKIDRTELLKAINHSRSIGGTLAIAKLDRLSRNVAFTATLMESGANFVACDNPQATKLTIHVLAAVAEEEARAISQRTKDALTAYKARGGKLGAHRPNSKPLSREAARRGSQRGGQTMRQKAKEASTHVWPTIIKLRKEGKSLREISAVLNGAGFITRRGKQWNATQVKRVLDNWMM
jgi:DNA invertase Pin-like site-specific DNA recombinase